MPLHRRANPSGGLDPSQPPQLGIEVRPGPPLASADRDGGRQPGERAGEPLGIGSPAAPAALLEPLDGAAVAALAVAPGAGGHLVLRPRRPALEPGHDVLGRGMHVGSEGAPAPDAGAPVAVERGEQPGGAAGCADGHHSPWSPIDEFPAGYHLFTTTTVVGGGKRSFPDGARLELRLVEQRAFASGLVYARYRTR
jgi:hypothetical protein